MVNRYIRTQGEKIYAISTTHCFYPQSMTLFKMHLTNPEISQALALQRTMPSLNELHDFAHNRPELEFEDERDEVRVLAGARRVITPQYRVRNGKRKNIQRAMNALLLLDQLYRDRLSQYFEEISEKTFFMDNTRKKLQLINQHLARAPAEPSPSFPGTAYGSSSSQKIFSSAGEDGSVKHLLPRKKSDFELTRKTASTLHLRTPLRSNT